MPAIGRAGLAVLGPALVTFALGSVAPADGKTRLGRVYGGVTEQANPLVFELTRSGQRVHEVRLMVDPACSDGQPLFYFATLKFVTNVPAFVANGEHVFVGGRLSKPRKFRASGIGAEEFGDVGGAFSEKIAGKVSRSGTASGTYSAAVQLIDDTGTVVATCKSGTVRWHARSARGRIYAGSTSAGHPIVVELDKRRTTVKHLRFGWAAPCTPDGFLLTPDHLLNLAIAHGKLSDGVHAMEPLPVPAGGKRALDYAIDGRVTRTAASGTFSVKLTDSDSGGAVLGSCDSGSVTWSARSG